MSEIMLIRKFDKPVGVDYLHQATIALSWCRKLYGVDPVVHFLARDGQRCACIFDAPDAEAVRNVIRTGGRSEPEAVWPCTVLPGTDDNGSSIPAGPDTALVVVEYLHNDSPPGSDRLHTEVATPARTNGIRYLRSYVSNDGLRAVSIFTESNPGPVHEAHRVAGLKFNRLWMAHAIDGASAKAELQPLESCR